MMSRDMAHIEPPDIYPDNLCDLPKELQHAIEVDKQRWYLAYKKFTACSRKEVQAWLDSKTDDPDVRQDMVRRFNILDVNQAKKLDAATRAMQQGLKEAKR